MNTLFSTANVHVSHRFDYWHSVACANIVDHDSIPENRRAFRAELQSGSLDDLGLVLFENSPMYISHTVRHLARAAIDEIFVCRQVGGQLALEQDGREVLLEPGDIALLDPRLPYTGTFFRGSRLLVLKIPRELLEARIGKTRQMIARGIKPSEAEHSLTSAFLAMLPDHAGRLGVTAEGIVKDQVLDLVAVSLAKAMQARLPRISSARSLVLTQVRAAIERRLADPALDAATVAAAAGVSVRYANAVLAEENTSIMRLVQERRLEHCRRVLADSSQAHRTVSEIAYSWGFSDTTHFGRRFKAVYGSPPTEYRRRMRAD